MKPLFTIHAGEYLVGSHVEHQFRRVKVWIPTKDTGIDLLVSDRLNRQCVSLQVKFSKDWLVNQKDLGVQRGVKAIGWWTIDSNKLRHSKADYWVFVLQDLASRSFDFVVIPSRELFRRLQAIHGRRKRIQTYLWITNKGRCWETRDLKKRYQISIADGTYKNKARDFTNWLNTWLPIARLNR